jgi:hypothetical protein
MLTPGLVVEDIELTGPALLDLMEYRLGEFGAVNTGHWPGSGGAGPRSAPAMSAAPHITSAQASVGGRTERRLDGADREFAPRRRPAPNAAEQHIAATQPKGCARG